ncbi:MAG TPA: ATP phosphoribosyltransferase [Verrucomicrobiae bacterium]|nr:ATP phosphoribosyltransferase [Verrucomicrobiae bacterium]
MLRLALPKGSLEEQTLALLEAADLPLRRGSSRDYHGRIADARIERVSLLRPQEIPRFVEDDFFDLGVTGRDWVVETGVNVVELASLDYARSGTGQGVKIVLAVAVDHPANRAAELEPGSRISTEYPSLTQAYFERLGRPMRVFPSYGATEAKVPGIVDAIVDVTETGSTLRAHGLKVIETLLESEVLLIAGPAAARDPARRVAMEEIATILVGALRAQGRVLLKLNVGEADLARVLGVLPAMKAPTVSPLAAGGGYAVETVVEKRVVNTLIPSLRSHGATDILELPIRKIIP